MDADRRIIRIVEDNQGEGMMDPLDIDEVERSREERGLIEDAALLAAEGGTEERKLKKRDADERALSLSGEIPPGQDSKPPVAPQVKLVKMDNIKEGDKLGFYAVAKSGAEIALHGQPYRIVRMRKNGSIVLKRCKK